MGKFQDGLYQELSLYVRHTAWLHAVLERPKSDRSTTPMKSRLQRLKDSRGEDFTPEMPPLEGGAHLFAYLLEIGPTMLSGMGNGPLTNAEIYAWQELTGVPLQSWEARCLRRLSRDYVAQSHEAEKPDCPAPWVPEDHAPDVAAVANDMRAAIGRLAKK